MERVISFFGLVVMLLLAWLLSAHKRRVPYRIIVGGLFLQFVFALVILRTEPGRRVFMWLGRFFRALLDLVDEGVVLVFSENFRMFFFAFKVLPTIIFFSSLMAVLYHLGIMQRVIRLMAVIMQKTLRTSGAESMAAAANVFVGQTEAPLVIRPYLAAMTQSELMATMVGGFATVAGGVLAAYVGMGVSAGHLITASVISAPAALLIAKIMQPELDHPKTMGRVEIRVEKQGVNLIDAAAKGASDGVKLAINVAAMLIAFLGLLALVNALVGSAGDVFGQQWSLEAGFGYLFAPFAWLMGVPSSECLRAGELLGLKVFSTEFIAYQRLSEWLTPTGLKSDIGQAVSERTEVILTYALCGFANFGSIGIQIGGIGPLAPERQTDLARLGLRAMIGGILAAFVTACVAGILV